MKLHRLVAVILLAGLLVGAVAYCLSNEIARVGTPVYIGNVRTGVFHRRSCICLPQEKNRAYFHSRREAVEAGYRPCLMCEP
ncbi:MAG: Ada metal-binding domain-containing protein [Armatimonadota bacterium]|nr:hypothetical protein [bacterium]